MPQAMPRVKVTKLLEARKNLLAEMLAVTEALKTGGPENMNSDQTALFRQGMDRLIQRGLAIDALLERAEATAPPMAYPDHEAIRRETEEILTRLRRVNSDLTVSIEAVQGRVDKKLNRLREGRKVLGGYRPHPGIAPRHVDSDA